jgi:type IV secretion system protein TrbB
MTQTLADRHHAMLNHALGDLVREALAHPGTVEVMANPDTTLWRETYGAHQVLIGSQPAAVTRAVIELVAALNKTEVHAGKPSLAATLPTGERFQGWLPPRSKAPAFCIRVPKAQVLTRDDYVPACCTAEVWDLLAQAIAARETILFAGGMSSGKSTILNAMLALVPPHIRMVTIEDTAETIVTVPNHLQLYGTADEDLDLVVKEGFRSAAQSMPVGEIRDGKTARQALQLWMAIGGGLATTHADSARDALTRLQFLCGQDQPGDYGYLIGGVIDWVVFLQTVAGRRQVAEVLRVGWKDGAYDLETVLDLGGGARRRGAALLRAG